MLAIDAAQNHFCVRAAGKLTTADYRNFEPRFAQALTRKILPAPLLLDLRGFRGWTVGGAMQDVIFNLRHRASFSRIATIGDKNWHKWITYAGIPVFRARLKYFNAKRRATCAAMAAAIVLSRNVRRRASTHQRT